MPPIFKVILTTLGIFAAVAGVAFIGIYLYDTFGTPFTIVWGIAVILGALMVTGSLGAITGKK